MLTELDERVVRLEVITRSLAARVGELEGTAPPLVPSVTVSSAPSQATIAPPMAGSAAPHATPVSDPVAPRRALAHRLDDLLGGRLLAWLGGLALLVGLLLFFAYAVSRGWLGPWARVGCGAVASSALLWFGVRLQRGHRASEAAPTIAAVGLAGLFMTVIVASRVYGLVPAGAGMALAMGVGAAATWLALRWNARVIAALGIVGALAAPIGVGAPDDLGTLMILLAAALSAVGVLVWRRWQWLAVAAVVICAAQWLPWLLRDPGSAAALLVLVSFGLVGHLAAVGLELRLPRLALRPASSLIVTGNAALLAIAGYVGFAQMGETFSGQLWVAALALVHAALALMGRRTQRISEDLTLLLATVAMLLADAAFASLASGPVIAVGWALTGTAFAYLYGRQRRPGHSRRLLEAGLGGHLFSGLIVAICQPGLLAFGADDKAGGIVAVVALAAAAFISGQLTGPLSRSWRTVLHVSSLALLAYLTAVTVNGPGLAVAWALEGASLGVIGQRTRDELAALASLVFLAGAGIDAGTVQAPLSGLVLGVAHLGNAVVALGVVAAAALTLAHCRLTVAGRPTSAGLTASGLISLLYLASVAIITAFQPSDAAAGSSGLDLAVRQQGQLLLSGLWGMTGVAVLILGLRRDQRLLRLGAIGLLLITAAKVTFYDLSTLDSIYRIASVVVIGVLLLAGARAYERLRPAAGVRG